MLRDKGVQLYGWYVVAAIACGLLLAVAVSGWMAFRAGWKRPLSGVTTRRRLLDRRSVLQRRSRV
jgi:hypothetical protein